MTYCSEQVSEESESDRYLEVGPNFISSIGDAHLSYIKSLGIN